MTSDQAKRNRWKSAGYGEGMASAIAARPPSSDDFIRLYHLAPAHHALSNIEQGWLKVARYADLNDPFELLPLNSSDPVHRKSMHAIKQSENDVRGIVCFSEDWVSPVMWGHYADSHQGICLGFDVLKSSVMKVLYKTFRAVPAASDFAKPDQLSPELQAVLRTTKCHEWSYEREHRITVQLADARKCGDLQFLPFSDNLRLAEVILGSKCAHSVEQVRQLVRASFPDAITFKARLAFNYFQIVPDRRTVPEV